MEKKRLQVEIRKLYKEISPWYRQTYSKDRRPITNKANRKVRRQK